MDKWFLMKLPVGWQADDHIREAQGASCRTIEDCPSGPEETEDGEGENDIGVRKREWLETNR